MKDNRQNAHVSQLAAKPLSAPVQLDASLLLRVGGGLRTDAPKNGWLTTEAPKNGW